MPVSDIQVKELIRRFKKVKGSRVTWDSHWEDIAKYILPIKGNILAPGTPGAKKMKELYDGTGIWCNEILAAGFNTWLTSMYNKWFTYKAQNKELMRYENVKIWLQEAEKRMNDMYNNSNFGDKIHESYLDDGSFGVSILYVEPDVEDICRFYTRHISECYILENNKGRVDTIFRIFPFTARQAFQTWSKSVGPEILKIYEKDPEKELEFLHVIQPREERNEQSSTRDNMPYASIHIYPKTNLVLDEGGYQEMPFMVNRWIKGTGEIYGRSPAMTALSDIKMVNKMGETTIKAGQMALQPPIIAPDDGIIGSVRMVPAGITYVRASMLEKGMEPKPFKIQGDVKLGLEMEDQRRAAIQKYFLTELFLLLMDRPQMTATEVVERVDEKMTILSPALSRQINEKLKPLDNRCFNIMLRGGFFPPVPPELHGQTIKVEYIGKLARVQKLYENSAIRNTLRDVSDYAVHDPTVLDNINGDEIFNIIAENNEFPQRAINSRIKVKRIRQARQDTAMAEEEKDDAERLVQGMATAKNAG